MCNQIPLRPAMITLLLLSAASAAVVIGEPCPFLHGPTLALAAADNVTVIVCGGESVAKAYATRASPADVPYAMAQRSQLSSMELFHRARSYPDVADGGAVLTVDCWSGRMGLRFAEFTVGMDCGVAELQRRADAVDAMDPADTYTLKTAHVLRGLAAWREQRLCHAWTADVSKQAVAMGWLVMLLMASACRNVRTHFTDLLLARKSHP